MRLTGRAELDAPLDHEGNLCKVGDTVESTNLLRKDRKVSGKVVEIRHVNCLVVEYDDIDGMRSTTSAAFLWRRVASGETFE